VWREGDRLTLHTAGKFRGPVFEPLHFVLKTVQLAGRTDARGRPVFQWSPCRWPKATPSG
jgi:hypothetical protein